MGVAKKNAYGMLFVLLLKSEFKGLLLKHEIKFVFALKLEIITI